MIHRHQLRWILAFILALTTHLAAFLYSISLPGSEPVYRGRGTFDRNVKQSPGTAGIFIQLGKSNESSGDKPDGAVLQEQAPVQRADETPAQAFAAGEGNPGSSVKGTEPTENLEPAGKRVAERSVHTPEKEVGPALKKIRDAKEPETDFAAAPIPRRRPKRADLLPELETLGQRLSVQEPPGTSWPVARAERSNVKATREGAKNSADKSKSDERTISSLSFENRGGQLGTASGNRTGEVRELNYQDRVLLWLKQHGAYPYEAAMYRLQDTVMLKFAINRDGKILYYQLTKKSKWHLLNRAVERMMDRSSPVPPIPPEISKNEITFTVPVEFDPKLRE